MKRIFSNTFVALASGFCLRLYFVLKYPANSGDTVLYEQIAANWLKHHVYAMDVGGAVTPVDLRMPGYPAFLAIVYALTGRTRADARMWVMLAQIAVDLLACLVIARLAELLASTAVEARADWRVRTVALWLAVLCPFTANYTAVPLTEKFTYIPPSMSAGFMFRTNEPVFPRVTSPVLWTVITAAAGSGPPSGYGASLAGGWVGPPSSRGVA